MCASICTYSTYTIHIYRASCREHVHRAMYRRLYAHNDLTVCVFASWLCVLVLQSDLMQGIMKAKNARSSAIPKSSSMNSLV